MSGDDANEKTADGSDLPTMLALTDCVSRMREAGKSVDDVIAMLRTCTAEMIESLRVDAVMDAIMLGPCDMKTLCARGVAAGCTLHAAQVQKVIDTSKGIKATTDKGATGRPRTVYRFIDPRSPDDTGEGSPEPADRPE